MKLTRCKMIVLLCTLTLLTSCAREGSSWMSSDLALSGITYIHPESGMQFPGLVEAFQRVNARSYSDSGQDDVGIGYKSILRYVPISVTVYVYPIPSIYKIDSPSAAVSDPERFLMDNSFSDITSVILSLHKDTVLLKKQTFTLQQNGRMINGRKALFQYRQPVAGAQQEVLSELYLFRSGPWFVKYRATYPKTVQNFAEDHIVDFMKSLTIPASTNRFAVHESGHPES
jgi:hypothetical protein